MSTKYYAAVDHRDVIYGVGRTPEEALADAGQYRLKRLYTVPCTEGVYNELFDSTYTHGKFTTVGRLVCLVSEA